MRVSDVQFDRSQAFDIDVSVCGYESRSIYVAQVVTAPSPVRLAVDYESVGVGEYDNNVRSLSEMGWLRRSEEQVLAELRCMKAGVSVRVDISSMRRTTIAKIVELLNELGLGQTVQFVYAPARYELSAQAASNALVLSAGPVTSYFVGAVRPSSIPLGLVAGLGLEPHRVLGVAELLEPTRMWAFIAESDDSRFAASVRSVHQPILGDPNTLVLPYDLRSPAETYGAIESLAFAAGQKFRLVLAPSGPKIFALICLLAATPRTADRPAVWRVGSQTSTTASDVEATGDVVAADVSFSNTDRDPLGYAAISAPAIA